MTARRRFLAAPLLLIGLALTGCQTHATGTPQKTTSQIKPNNLTGGTGISRVHDYESFAELRQASTAAVTITPVSSRQVTQDGLFTITTVTVRNILWGTLASSSIDLRQPGSATTQNQALPSVIEAGRQYLVFITPFHLVPGDSTGQFVITGDQGFYELQGSDYVLMAKDTPNLPKQFAASAAQAIVSS